MRPIVTHVHALWPTPWPRILPTPLYALRAERGRESSSLESGRRGSSLRDPGRRRNVTSSIPPKSPFWLIPPGFWGGALSRGIGTRKMGTTEQVPSALRPASRTGRHRQKWGAHECLRHAPGRDNRNLDKHGGRHDEATPGSPWRCSGLAYCARWRRNRPGSRVPFAPWPRP